MSENSNHINLEELPYSDSGEHAVLINFWYGKESDEEFYDMTLALHKFMEDNQIGRYDGHEINVDNTDGTLFFYGKNAEKLYKYILPELLKYDFLIGANVYLRFGGIKNGTLDIEFKLEPTQH
jgi:hypothetical protein